MNQTAGNRPGPIGANPVELLLTYYAAKGAALVLGLAAVLVAAAVTYWREVR